MNDSPLLAGIRFDQAKHGYRREQVDTFIIELSDKISELQELWRETNTRATALEAELATEADRLGIVVPASDPPSPFTRDETATPMSSLVFAEERRGYDKGQVDYFLRETGFKIAELQHLYQVARERGVTAEMRLAVLRRDAATSSG